MGSFSSDPLQGLVYYQNDHAPAEQSHRSNVLRHTSQRLGRTYHHVLEQIRQAAPKQHDTVNHEAAELLSRFKSR